MPVTLKLVTSVDPDNPVEGDIYLQNGSYVVIGDTPETFAEAVAQTIRNRLLFIKGEWFLDTTEGVPYFDDIWVVNPDLSLIRAIFKKVIRETDGVADVIDLDLALDRETRELTVNFEARLVDGTTLVSKDFAPFVVRM